MGTIRTPRGFERAARAAAAAFVATGGVMIGASAAHAADGGFVAGSRTPTGGATRLAAGDFNLDSRADLAVTDTTAGKVHILLGTAAGFTAAPDVAVGRGPRAIAVSDVNRDGADDLLVANALDDDVSIRTGDSAAGFAATPADLQAGAYTVVAGDFDGDDRTDLVTAGGSGGLARTYVSLGRADAQGKAVFVPGMSVQGVSGPVAVADLNRDGLGDIVVCGQTAGAGCRVLLGSGASTFTEGVPFTLPGDPGPRSLATGDFDGDGDTDLAALTTAGLVVRRGTPAGTLTAGTTIPVQGAPAAIAVADLDDDGRDDIVSATGEGTVRVHLSRAGSTFASRTAPASDGDIADVAVADFDGDGADDIALAVTGGVRVLRGTGGPARPGNLVVNGDFETGRTSINGAYPVVQGWRQVGLVTLVPYGFRSPLFYPSRLEAPRFDGGEQLLWGGSSAQGNAPSAFQDIDLSRSAAAIDAGRATATLSAFLGGARTYLDHAYVTAEFTRTKAGEEAENVLATAKVGPVGPLDRHNVTTLLPRETSLPVPRGARFVRVRVQTVDADNSVSSATADNVALTLAVTPEPRAGGAGGKDGGAGAGRRTFGRRTLVTLTVLRGRPLRVRVRNANGFAVTGRLLGAGAPRAFRVGAHRAATVRLRLGRRHPRVLRLRAAVTDPSGHRRVVVHRFRLRPVAARG